MWSQSSSSACDHEIVSWVLFWCLTIPNCSSLVKPATSWIFNSESLVDQGVTEEKEESQARSWYQLSRTYCCVNLIGHASDLMCLLTTWIDWDALYNSQGPLGAQGFRIVLIGVWCQPMTLQFIASIGDLGSQGWRHTELPQSLQLLFYAVWVGSWLNLKYCLFVQAILPMLK